MSKDKLVLVTGASGFIAGYTIKALLKRGYRVRGTVRSTKDMSKYDYLFNFCNHPQKKDLELVEADLTKPDGWEEATKDCDFCLHIASPFPMGNLKEEEVIGPAVSGVKYVLNACIASGVKKVVLTSSCAAIYPGHPKDKLLFTEDDFAVEENIIYYNKSKLLAEKEAWKIHKENEGKFALTTVNPSLVVGPGLDNKGFTSSGFFKDAFNGKFPSVPRLKMGAVAVEDVAEIHIRCMERPETDGERFIASSDTFWFKELMDHVNDNYRKRGYKKLPTSDMWYLTFYMAGWMDKNMKDARTLWKSDIVIDGKKSVRELGIKYKPVKPVILEMCEWLIETGQVKRSNKDSN